MTELYLFTCDGIKLLDVMINLGYPFASITDNSYIDFVVDTACTLFQLKRDCMYSVKRENGDIVKFTAYSYLYNKDCVCRIYT